MEAFVTIAVPIITGVVTSVLASVIIYMIAKNRKTEEEREADRVKRVELIFTAQDAQFSVTKELVRCYQENVKPNGKLTEAYKYQEKTKHEIEEYFRHKGSK